VKVLVVHPCASWSTADVHDGLVHGLRANGCEVIEYRMDARVPLVHNWAAAVYRKAKKLGRDVQQPSKADVFYKVSVEALEQALRHQVHAVVVMSGMFFHPDALILLRRANTPVAVLCTESPYDVREEMRIASLLASHDSHGGVVVNPPAGLWTNERSMVPAFQKVHPWSSYLAHAWHPAKHTPVPQPWDESVSAHDVVFVGTAFPERIEWFEAIDWRGIDLGLYGTWERLKPSSPLRKYVRGEQVANAMAASLYRRAKVTLNFYRQSMGWANNAPRITHAESLNPRAYELAACGAFHLSDHRAEVTEKFGSLVPTFSTAAEAQTLIRHYLAHDTEREAIAASLPACVAEDSWVHRARQVLGDLERLVTKHQRAA
jgi:spore maturation protein CgeB